ncbi:MAG: YraN family protein [Spirochaetia bacterium]|nr:YraN family protein [Spirochaetia bacterium]
MQTHGLESYQRGKEGEHRSVIYLQGLGYQILFQNWRTRTGEIDIIAFKEPFLVFVEVKTLPHGNLAMLDQVLGKIKRKRIIETAKYFVHKYRQYSNSYMRFDVLIVDMPGLPPLYHIENAFSENS